MERNLENLGEEELPKETEEIKPQEQMEAIEIPLEEKVDVALGQQDRELNQREAKYPEKSLTGLRKWIGIATVMGASFLAVGCGAEKSKGGFTDDVHKNVQQRVKISKAEHEFDRKMENYKPSKDAKDAAGEMNESSIIQPVDSGGGFTDKIIVPRPNKNFKPGPTGRVSNPEDL